MNPYLIAGSLLALVAAYVGGRHDGTRIERGAWQAREAGKIVKERELADQIKGVADEYEAGKAGREQAQREVRIETQRIIERPVYRNVCLDADGVRVTASAVRAANGEPSEPAGAVPEAPRTDGGDDDGRPSARVPD